MPSERRTLLNERLLALVGQEWIGVEDFLEQAIPLVPPGRAKREYDAQARRNDAARAARIAAGQKVIARRPEPTEAEQDRMGAQAIVNAFLGAYRDRQTIEIEGERNNRRIRLSAERKWSHHCCLHGGSCRAQDDEPDVPGPADPAFQKPLNPPELHDLAPEEEPLFTLVQRVLDSRSRRSDMVDLREVNPGEIDRLLAGCR